MRIAFAGPLELPDHLELMSRIDIALDAFPYSGQTTTCECLWMGVPVVTLAGERFASRVSAAILHRVGLGDWVAKSVDEYAAIAVSMAAKLPALAALRGRLRVQVATSHVCAGAVVMREIEVALRNAWRAWCERRKSFLPAKQTKEGDEVWIG